MTDIMVWVDVETTGLNGPHVEKLLEVGLIVTDKFGTELGSISKITAPFDQDDIEWDLLPEIVKEMHMKSGLKDEYEAEKKNSEYHFDDIEQELIEWLGAHTGGTRVPMCGNSVHFDRGFIAHYMPNLHDMFSHRNIDASGIREVCKLLNPRVSAAMPESRKEHRPISDLRDSIDMYQFFTDEFFHVAE